MGDIFEQSNLKHTKKREMMFSVLQNSSQPMTAEQVFEVCSTKMNIDLSTVYRALTALSEKGVIIRTLRQDGKTYYEINQKHGHHLICTECHDSVAIDGCPLKELDKQLSKQTGYTITGHNLEFSGICPKCMQKKKEKKQN